MDEQHRPRGVSQSEGEILRDLISIEEAASLLPMRPHHFTLQKWCMTGYRTPTGEYVVCEAVKFGRRLCTHPRWLLRFAQQVADAERKAKARES